MSEPLTTWPRGGVSRLDGTKIPAHDDGEWDVLPGRTVRIEIYGIRHEGEKAAVLGILKEFEDKGLLVPIGMRLGDSHVLMDAEVAFLQSKEEFRCQTLALAFEALGRVSYLIYQGTHVDQDAEILMYAPDLGRYTSVSSSSYKAPVVTAELLDMLVHSTKDLLDKDPVAAGVVLDALRSLVAQLEVCTGVAHRMRLDSLRKEA